MKMCKFIYVKCVYFVFVFKGVGVVPGEGEKESEEDGEKGMVSTFFIKCFFGL